MFGSSTTIPNSVTNLGDWAFEGCSLQGGLTIGNGIKCIGDSTFLGCKLGDVTIPYGVTNIGSSAFQGSAIPNVYGSLSIPNSVITIGANAFSACGVLEGLIIPDSVTYIGSGAFSQCNQMPSINIGNGITDIGADWFTGDDYVNTITVGSNVTNIESGAFVFGGLKPVPDFSVYFKGNAPGYTGEPINFGNYYPQYTTVYYMPNTTGWGTTYSGYPTVLWDAALSPVSANFSPNYGFGGVIVTGNPVLTVVIQASTNMTTWYPVSTNSPPFQFVDPQATNNIYTLYRVGSVN